MSEIDHEHTGPGRTGRVVGTAGAPMHPSRWDYWAGSMKPLTGYEPFGTHVTVWDQHEGPIRALIVTIDRGTFGSVEYVTTQITRSTGGISHYPGVPEGVTLGWHPDAR